MNTLNWIPGKLGIIRLYKDNKYTGCFVIATPANTGTMFKFASVDPYEETRWFNSVETAKANLENKFK
jgi:hypothetical protein